MKRDAGVGWRRSIVPMARGMKYLLRRVKDENNTLHIVTNKEGKLEWPHIAFNPLNPELNPICYLLALLAHHFLHVSRIRVRSLTLRLLMSYIYGAPILDVSRSHTTTQHSR